MRRTRKGIEALRSTRPFRSRERDELYRKLTAVSARKASMEVQLKSYEDRVKALTEILQKIHKEEAELASRLMSGTDLPSGNGEDKKQVVLPGAVRQKGKEMVFRF